MKLKVIKSKYSIWQIWAVAKSQQEAKLCQPSKNRKLMNNRFIHLSRIDNPNNLWFFEFPLFIHRCTLFTFRGELNINKIRIGGSNLLVTL